MNDTNRMLKTLARRPEIKTPIATDMFVPNHSGDLSAGKVLTTPTQDNDPTNKAYVDSAITTAIGAIPAPIIKTVTINISSAEILNLHTTPIEVLPAPGANKINIVDDFTFYFMVGGVRYTNGANMYLYYGATTQTASTGLGVSYVTGATDYIVLTDRLTPMSAAGTANFVNQTVVFKPATATAFLAGTGTIRLVLRYWVLDIS